MASKSSIGLLETIKTLDKKLLPSIWCSFNSWEFPSDVKEVSDLKPLYWKTWTQEEKFQFLKPISKYIESVIEPKEISREWNKERMTHKQFEEWWLYTWKGQNTLAKLRPQKKQMTKMFNKAMNIK